MAEWNANVDTHAYGDTSAFPATNEIPVDISRKTWAAFPQLTPLISILSKLRSDPAHQPRIDWQETHRVPTEVRVAAALAAGGTALSVSDHAKTLVADSLLFNPRTWDLASVDSTPTTDTAATISRSVGGTTGAAWLAGDILHVLPPAIAENDESYRAASVSDTNVYNYIQLVKMQFGLTRLSDKTHTHFGGPGSKRNSLKQQKYEEFRIKWEKLTVMGGRSSSGTAPATKYMMGGLIHYLRNGTLYKDFSGVMTESGFRNFLGDYADQNPDARNIMLFCAGNVSDIISDFGDGKVRINEPMQKKLGLGLTVQMYQRRGLTVNLMPMPLFTDSITRGWGFLLDLDRIEQRPIDPEMFYPEAKNVGESEIIYDTYRVATSLLLANESRHAMFVGAKL